MSVPKELKIVFTGPMGAGKTTAIATISDCAPVSTEVQNNDRQTFAKDSTTAALDFGQLSVTAGTVVRLYGTPGQERFSFMWEILAQGAMGVVLLIDASSPSALLDSRHYAQTFRRISPNQPLVVGVGRVALAPEGVLAALISSLSAAGILVPVFSVDVRKREDTMLLVHALLAMLEARLPESERVRA